MAINHYSNEKSRTFPVEGLSLTESPEAKGGVSGMEAARTGCSNNVAGCGCQIAYCGWTTGWGNVLNGHSMVNYIDSMCK